MDLPTLSSVIHIPFQDYAAEFYGPLPLNQSQSRPRRERVELPSLSNRDGETVLLRARIQTSRAQGNKMVFLNLRQGTDSVQALAVVAPEKISKQMVKWVAGLADESIVLVEGVVHKSPEPIKSATVSDIEVHITRVSYPIVPLPTQLPHNSARLISSRELREDFHFQWKTLLGQKPRAKKEMHNTTAYSSRLA